MIWRQALVIGLSVFAAVIVEPLVQGAGGMLMHEPETLATVAVVSIGPQTSQRCHQLLGRVDAEADPHDLEGLVEACKVALKDRPSPAGLPGAG